jgi:tight adherence protein B
MSWVAALALALVVATTGRVAPVARLVTLRAGCRDGPDPPSRAGPGWPAGLAAGGLLLVVHLPVPAAVAAVVAAAAVVRLRRRRRAEQLREQRSAATVEITFALAGELRAGRTPAEALTAVAAVAGPLGPAFEAARATVAMGGSAAEVIADAARLPGAERLRYVAAAWAVAASAGGRIAVVLEGLSEAMDDDDELRRELDAAMAGPRATIAMLGGLPLLGFGLGQAVGAHPLRLLLHQPLGWGLLAGAAALDGIGIAVTRVIARSALRP